MFKVYLAFFSFFVCTCYSAATYTSLDGDAAIAVRPIYSATTQSIIERSAYKAMYDSMIRPITETAIADFERFEAKQRTGTAAATDLYPLASVHPIAADLLADLLVASIRSEHRELMLRSTVREGRAYNRTSRDVASIVGLADIVSTAHEATRVYEQAKQLYGQAASYYIPGSYYETTIKAKQTALERSARSCCGSSCCAPCCATPFRRVCCIVTTCCGIVVVPIAVVATLVGVGVIPIAI